MGIEINAADIFSPREVLKENNLLFAGREDLFRDVLIQVDRPGISVILYGEERIGKSTLGVQLSYFLDGKTTETRIFKDYWKGEKPIKPNGEWYPVWFKCKGNFTDISDVIFNLIWISEKPTSFYQRFKSIYDSGALKRILQELEKLKNNLKQNDAFRLLQDTIEIISRNLESRNTKIIIFIDKIHRVKDKVGIEKLFEDVDGCQFVLIGTADHYTQLVNVSRYRNDRVALSTIEVKGLDKSSVEAIFKRVEEKFSVAKVKFQLAFVKSMQRHCAGFPGLIHDLGFESLQWAKRRTLEKGGEEPIRVTAEDLGFALKNYLDKNSDELHLEYLRKELEISKPRQISLFKKVISRGRFWTYVSSLEESIAPVTDKDSEPVAGIVDKLVGLNILKWDNNYQRVKFEDPYQRIFVQRHFDELES